MSNIKYDTDRVFYVDSIPVKTLEVELNNETVRYLCLTDIAKVKKKNRPDDVVRRFIMSETSRRFLGECEYTYNDEFNPACTRGIKYDNTYTISRWISESNAVGIISIRGKYSGVYAHEDIAQYFAQLLDPRYALRVIKEYRAFKKEADPTFNLNRDIIRDDVRKGYLPMFNKFMEYCNIKGYGDSFNKAIQNTEWLNELLFGKTSKEFKHEHPELTAQRKNLRDVATFNRLYILDDLQDYIYTLCEHEVDVAVIEDLVCKRIEKYLKKVGLPRKTDKQVLERDNKGFIKLIVIPGGKAAKFIEAHKHRCSMDVQ